eukprot:CAMPEP_0117591120 /NCGR_PEP_ID=MMETSP0784-20121206/71349_1 /TAXON_ID=39447 /ORGANISM="" /LENGTH=57 /DNA_ID=CAMNT_0005392793 /DNA_START=75 /DNA_END=245 /DNA_ORIENTATION=+
MRNLGVGPDRLLQRALYSSVSSPSLHNSGELRVGVEVRSKAEILARTHLNFLPQTRS